MTISTIFYHDQNMGPCFLFCGGVGSDLVRFVFTRHEGSHQENRVDNVLVVPVITTDERIKE
jgi:hypothetical protein